MRRSAAEATLVGLAVRLRRIRDRVDSARSRGLDGDLLLAGIVEQSDDAIFGKALDGTITSWNRGAERMYGYTAAEIVGDNVRLLAPDRRDEVQSILDRLPLGEEVSHLQAKRVRKDGTEIDVSLTISPIRDRSGVVIGASTIARDVTEQRRLEARLQRAQKMEAVGELAGGIAHDFNNMLTAIIGHAERADSALDDVARRGAIDGVLAAAASAARLTRQLLAFSSRQVLQPEVVDIRDTVAGLDSLLRRTLGEEVTLETTSAPALWAIRVDPSQLEQVLLNLIVNARDALPYGGRVSLDISNVTADASYVAAKPDLNLGRYVAIAVSDTGTGMDEATLARIFEPFFTTKSQGTGLGLATTLGIVRQSGGDVTVYSEPGQGTTFRVLFPAADGSSVRQPVAEDAAHVAFAPATVLIVEDEALVREVVVSMLEGAGFRVFAASSPSEARRIAETATDPIELIISDVMLPDQPGPELAVELRRLQPNAKYLFTSGYAYREGVGLDDVAGAAFLAKPFTGAQLKAKVAEVLAS